MPRPTMAGTSFLMVVQEEEKKRLGGIYRFYLYVYLSHKPQGFFVWEVNVSLTHKKYIRLRCFQNICFNQTHNILG